MGALANPEVGAFINKHFVSSFQKVATFQIVNGQKQGGNVASYFCAPDGRVLHCVAGPVDAATMLREARWVVDSVKKAMEESKKTEVPFKALFRRWHAARLRQEYGLVVEPATFDSPTSREDDPLSYNDPSGRPVLPVLIEGAYEAWPRSSKWPRWGRRIRLRVGENAQVAAVMRWVLGPVGEDDAIQEAQILRLGVFDGDLSRHGLPAAHRNHLPLNFPIPFMSTVTYTSADGTIIRADVNASASDPAAWQKPVHIYFRRSGGAWTLIGLDRGIGDTTPPSRRAGK